MQTQSRSKWRFAVLGWLAALAMVIAPIVAVRQAAHREYAAYETLCSLGASGDDWFSILELITGRPPIVQIDIPADVPVDTTFALIPALHNLESLSIAYNSLSKQQLDAIHDLKLHSLSFNGDFPSDADVKRLSRFRDVTFISIPSRNLSAEAQQELRKTLPTPRIDFD